MAADQYIIRTASVPSMSSDLISTLFSSEHICLHTETAGAPFPFPPSPNQPPTHPHNSYFRPLLGCTPGAFFTVTGFLVGPFSFQSSQRFMGTVENVNHRASNYSLFRAFRIFWRAPIGCPGHGNELSAISDLTCTTVRPQRAFKPTRKSKRKTIGTAF